MTNKKFKPTEKMLELRRMLLAIPKDRPKEVVELGFKLAMLKRERAELLKKTFEPQITLTPSPGALVTVLLNKNGTRRCTAMVVDVSVTNFVLVELMGSGKRKGKLELRFILPERVLRREPDMLSQGSDALLWQRKFTNG